MAIVYVICSDHTLPSGGIMKLYELVDILNKFGIQSYVVHKKKGFRVTWFPNDTQVIDYQSVHIKPDDIIILPEGYAAYIPNLCPGIRKIIYNQNSFNTFKPFQNCPQSAYDAYFHCDVILVLAVSSYDVNVLSTIFPGLNVHLIHTSVNENFFQYSSHKKRTISVMPRKMLDDFFFLQSLLVLKNELYGYNIKVINEAPLEEVARTLKESEIFLSFSHKESFGLPAAEAMACGCIVIGYDGQGGKEFLKNNLTYITEQSDILGFAKCVKHVIREFDENPTKMKKMGEEASVFILNNYSISKQQDSIKKMIDRLFSE